MAGEVTFPRSGPPPMRTRSPAQRRGRRLMGSMMAFFDPDQRGKQRGRGPEDSRREKEGRAAKGGREGVKESGLRRKVRMKEARGGDARRARGIGQQEIGGRMLAGRTWPGSNDIRMPLVRRGTAALLPAGVPRSARALSVELRARVAGCFSRWRGGGANTNRCSGSRAVAPPAPARARLRRTRRGITVGTLKQAARTRPRMDHDQKTGTDAAGARALFRARGCSARLFFFEDTPTAGKARKVFALDRLENRLSP